jgi:hypothetical protein
MIFGLGRAAAGYQCQAVTRQQAIDIGHCGCDGTGVVRVAAQRLNAVKEYNLQIGHSGYCVLTDALERPGTAARSRGYDDHIGSYARHYVSSVLRTVYGRDIATGPWMGIVPEYRTFRHPVSDGLKEERRFADVSRAAEE